MTTSIRSLGISFDLQRHRSLRGEGDVRNTLAKTCITIISTCKHAPCPTGSDRGSRCYTNSSFEAGTSRPTASSEPDG